MKKLALITLFNCFVMGSLVAQDAVFSVILNRGGNTSGTGTSFDAVLVGASLSKDAVLRIVDGGYVALVHEQTGSSLELSASGDYTVAELEQKISDQSSSLLSKYGKFLVGKLNPEDEGNQNLNVTGAVERGEAGLIKIYWPSIMDVYGDEAVVTWQRADEFDEYVVTIKNMFDDIILEKTVNGTSYTMKLDDEKMKNEKLMILNIKVKENEGYYSRDYGIKRLSAKEQTSIGQEFEELIKVANDENSLNKLFIASFFEEHQLLVDAITYYNQALAISPDPEGFNKLYNNFLRRNGLK